MRYPLQETPARAMLKVIAGCASDARWRDVPADVDRIDSLRRHELGLEAERATARTTLEIREAQA